MTRMNLTIPFGVLSGLDWLVAALHPGTCLCSNVCKHRPFFGCPLPSSSTYIQNFCCIVIVAMIEKTWFLVNDLTPVSPELGWFFYSSSTWQGYIQKLYGLCFTIACAGQKPIHSHLRKRCHQKTMSSLRQFYSFRFSLQVFFFSNAEQRSSGFCIITCHLN